MSQIIDFHTHLSDHWFETPLISEQDFIKGLDECGVETACVFTLMGFYNDCPRENDRLADAARRHPGRIVPFITVDPKLGDEAVVELERCLQDPVFRGVKFHPWVQSFAPSMRRETMIQILQLAAAHGRPVLFHDGTPPYSTTFQIAALARWVPEATVVLGHAGLADYVYPAGQLMRTLPNLHACLCCPKTGDLLYLIEAAGEDRIMFGSDFSIGGTGVLKERLREVRESKLDARVLHKILYANAARALHLQISPDVG